MSTSTETRRNVRLRAVVVAAQMFFLLGSLFAPLTAGVAVSRIHEIQGATHRSPVENLSVASIPGIVTAKRSNGFYMQDSTPDADDATSEGIFVFTSSAPTSVNVGDSVLVGGTVVEFRAGGASSTNLTITEISSPSITVISSANPLPAPTIIGTGGRLPPTAVIEDDATGDVETSGIYDPANDGIDFYESLEGMRVQVNNAVAVGPTSVFNTNREIAILGDNGANAGVRTTRGGIVIGSADFNPERIILNDLISGGPVLPDVNVADTFPGAIIGVMDYTFGNFKLEVTSVPAAVSGGLTREVTDSADTDQLAVGTFNVENLDPGDGAAKFNTLAGLIVNNLKSPDILMVEEVQDNNGPTNDAVTDATTTYNTLITAIQTAGGPTYQFRQIDPVDDQDGGEPGGNIRQGFLFRTDRGLAFVDRPGGCSTCATTVVDNAGTPELSFSPGRIDPTNPAFSNSRKPLSGEFTFNGHTLFVIANHFNSKGGDQPLYGHFQPPVNSSEVQRAQQAQVVNNFVDAILAVDSTANVIVAGDINDFEFSGTVTTLKGGVLSDLIETLPQGERYSYVFEGNSETLDHVLVSNNLFNNTTFEFDVVHINSEFADQASDHDASVARFYFAVASDPPDTTIDTSPPDPSNSSSASFTFSGTDDVTPPGSLTFECKLDDGTFGDCTSPQDYSGLIDGPHTFYVQAIDGESNVDPTPASFTWMIDTAPPPGGTVSFVKTIGTATKSVNPNAFITVPVPGSGVAAGHSIIVALKAGANTVTATCTDPKGNSYHQDVAAGGGGVPRAAILSAHNVAALVGGDVITCNYASFSGATAISINEFSGLAAAPLDKVASNAGTSSSPNSGLTATTTQADELVFGYVQSIAWTPATSGSSPSETYADPPNSSPYTEVGTLAGGQVRPAYRIVGTTRQYQANGTGGGTGGWRSLIATYKAGPAVTNSATFTVSKDFSDDSDASVTVSLSCDIGSASPASAPASEATPAVFTVTGYTPGATCTATETPVPGYSSSGTCSGPIIGASAGTGACTITNTLLPPPAISFVKTIGTATHGAGFFSTLVVDVPPAGVAAGNRIIVSMVASSKAGVIGCSDTKGNAYGLDVQAGGGGISRSAILSAHVVTALGDPDTITCTFPTSSTGSAMSVNEFSGLAATSALDGTSSAAGSSSSPNSGLTAMTTQGDELVFGYVQSLAWTPATSGSNPPETYAGSPNFFPYTVIAGTPANVQLAYRIVGVTRQYQANGTGGGTGGWRALIATYRGAP